MKNFIIEVEGYKPIAAVIGPTIGNGPSMRVMTRLCTIWPWKAQRSVAVDS